MTKNEEKLKEAAEKLQLLASNATEASMAKTLLDEIIYTQKQPEDLKLYKYKILFNMFGNLGWWLKYNTETPFFRKLGEIYAIQSDIRWELGIW